LLAIPLLFGTNVIQARILYVIPLFVPAVLAFYNPNQKNNTIFSFSAIALGTSVLVYTLLAMTNLYFVVPENFELEKPFLIP